MSNDLTKLQSELKSIDLSLKQYVESLRTIVESSKQTQDKPQRPDLHFVVEGFQAQRCRVAKCIFRVTALLQAERLEASMLQRMLDSSRHSSV